MVLFNQGLGIHIRPENSKRQELWSYDAFFDSLINIDTIDQDGAKRNSHSHPLSLPEPTLIKIVKSRSWKNAHEEAIQNAPTSQVLVAAPRKADDLWIEATPDTNNAASLSGSTSPAAAPLQTLSGFSLADTIISSSVWADRLQKGLHAPHNSPTNSPSFSPASPFNLSHDFQSLYIHENERQSSPSPQFTLRTELSYEVARSSSSNMETMSQYQQLPWDMAYRQDNMYNQARIVNSGANLLPPPSELAPNIPKIEMPLELAPITNCYGQHPNTPIASPSLMSSNPSSTSSMGTMAMNMSIQNQVSNFSTMNLTHVDPRTIVSPQPTRPMVTSPPLDFDPYGAVASGFRGRGNSNMSENKAENVWQFDNDSIVGAQNPNNHHRNQRGRTCNSAQLPKMDMTIEDLTGRVMGMPTANALPMRHGGIVEADNISRSNGRSPVNSASSTSQSCPDLLIAMSPAYSELAAQQKSQAHRQMASQSQSWSPNVPLFPQTPTQSHNAMNLPIRNTSRNSGTSPHPKVTAKRPVTISISNNGVNSPTPPCRSPVYGSGKTIQTPSKRCKSSGYTRRKSSCGESNSPLHADGGFVNYTPEHKKLILKGVAPSGSSKTKARREREEKEKRRKVGEAYEKLVLQAVQGQDYSIVELGIQALKTETLVEEG